MQGLKSLILFVGMFLVLSWVAMAADGASTLPENWQMDFQVPVTPVMEKLTGFHNLLLVIEGVIGTLVLVLLIYVIYRFHASRNPVPSKTSHHTMLEVVWTAIPVLILVVIVFPSMRLLYFMDVVPEAQLNLKVTGNQWYWSYEYPDHGISFDSIMVEDKDLKPGDPRLLAVDNHVVVPVNTVVRVIATSADVIHSWAIPAFGVKRDTVPGRINEVWFNATKEGTYYGQCSELCGIKHGFMPIVIDVVSQAKFDLWLAEKKPAAPAVAPVAPAATTPATTAASAATLAPAVPAQMPSQATPTEVPAKEEK